MNIMKTGDNPDILSTWITRIENFIVPNKKLYQDFIEPYKQLIYNYDKYLLYR